MSDFETIAVTLDVTVHARRWREQTGLGADVVQSVSVMARDWAAMTPRLLQHNATVAMISATDITPADTRQLDFLTVRLTLDVIISATTWRAAYGLDAQTGIPPYLAVELSGPSEFRDSVRGTVAVVDSLSGLVIGHDVISVHRSRR